MQTHPEVDAKVDAKFDAKLTVVEGRPAGRVVALGEAPILIGRSNEADLQLHDPTVSRHHCVVWRSGERCWVRDLGSTNRTCVNGAIAPVIELFDGDTIAIGHTLVAVALRSSADDTASTRITEKAAVLPPHETTQ
jgi:pSer/pThr/pTyr-binding forkhead associated (FHA) protein